MGILGLTSHLKRLGYAGKTVSLLDELCKVEGQPLGLVFDASGMYQTLIHYPFGMHAVSIQHGGQLLHFYFVVRAFCEIFVQKKIPIHFVFDGLTGGPKKKRRDWEIRDAREQEREVLLSKWGVG